MAQSTMTFAWQGGRAEFGKQLTINISRDSQSYRHHLVIQLNGSVIQDLWGVTNTATYTPSMSFMSSIPRNTQTTFSVICYTYNGAAQIGNLGTYIGSQTKSTTIFVPDSVVPTLSSAQLSDPTGYLSTYGAYVATKSKIRAVITAAGVYGSTIEQYKLSIGTTYGATSESNTVTIDKINVTGQTNVTATALDSRNRYKQLTQKVNVASYANPSLLGTSAKRWSGSSENDDSSTVRVFVKGSVHNVNNKGLNTGTVKIETAAHGSSSWTSRNTRSVASGAFSYTFDVSGLSNNSRWQVRVTVTDSFGVSAQSVMPIETASAVMDLRGDGTGIAFGAVSTSANEMQSNWRIRPLRGIKHTESIAGTNGSVGPWIKVGTWESASTQGACLIIRMYGGNGQNGSPYQNTSFEIFIKKGWTGESDGKYFGGTMTIDHVQNGQNVQLRVIQKSTNSCEVWVYFPWEYDKASYIVEMTDGIWTGGGSQLSTSTPSGGTVCDVEVRRLMSADEMFPVGTVLIRYDHTSPASIYGGTWARISGRFLYATVSTGTIGATGGSGTSQLLQANIPTHSHTMLHLKGSWREATGAGLWDPGNAFSGRGIVYTTNTSSSSWAECQMTQVGNTTEFSNNPAYIHVSVWRRTA